MCESLHRASPDANIYAFTFDALAEQTMRKLSLPRVTVVSLEELESQKLLAIKPHRTSGEYCWTCKPSAITHVFDHFGERSCIYADADLFFLGSPTRLENSLRRNSVLLTPHNFSPRYDLSATTGYYSAQMVGFANDGDGRHALSWWEDRCLEWCYARHEAGRYGDQKYLETMATKYRATVTSERGVLGPWNMDQYTYSMSEQGVQCFDIKTKDYFHAIFFHFHGFRLHNTDKSYSISGFRMTPTSKRYLYNPYAGRLYTLNKEMRERFLLPSCDQARKKKTVRDVLRSIRNIVYNNNPQYRID